MKRILLVDAGDSTSMLEHRYRPLWPGYLASYVEKHSGNGEFDFRYLTRNLHDEIRSYRPDVVAISSVSLYYLNAVEFARIAKMHNLPVVIGGIHISSMPHTLSRDMDVACIGEGGATFLELLTHFVEYGRFRFEHLDGVRGIIFRKDGQLVQTASRPFFKALDDMPHPKRSLTGYHRSATMLTSRGCPFKCVFCSATRHWPEVIYASADYVMEELAELTNKGVKIIRLYDELFTANKKRLYRIAEMMVDRGFHKKVRLACWLRASTVSPEVVRLLKAMNVVAAEMGLESGCNRTLKYLKNSGSVEENLNAVVMLKEAGIQANASFIIGAPDESIEEIMATYEFIRKSPLDTVYVNRLIAFPGTGVWEYAKARGLVSDYMDWSKLNGVVLSVKVSGRELQRLVKKFNVLCFEKRLKALPKSPWLADLPRVAAKEIAERCRRWTRTFMNFDPH